MFYRLVVVANVATLLVRRGSQHGVYYVGALVGVRDGLVVVLGRAFESLGQGEEVHLRECLLATSGTL